MNQLIPPFDWHDVIVQPWTSDFTIALWTVLMGFFVTAACGLVGNFLLLRRMALVGDAISHSVLPGLVLAFLIFRHNSPLVSLGGALMAGLATVVLIEFIHKQSRIKPDAAICITFTTLFALGVALMSALESHGSFHIDAECVLYGEIAFVPLEPPFTWLGVEWGPPSALRMAGVLVAVLACITAFYKELLVTSFDPGLAKSIGLRIGVWHYGLMAAVSIVIVSAFESVGAILSVAMLIVPPMCAAQISHHLPTRLALTVAVSALSALIGYHLSVWLNCSAAGAMVTASAGLFVLAWLFTGLMHALARRDAQREALVTKAA